MDQGLSYQEIANVLFLDSHTIRRYFTAYQEGGIDGLILLKYQGRPFQLSEEERNLLKAHLKENIDLSASQVRFYIKEAFSIEYTAKGVVNLLHRLGFAYKKPKLVPGKADAEKQKAFLEEYNRLKEEQKEGEELLFMDGVHPQHNSKPAYGWIEKGKVKELQSNTGRKRININGALNPENLEVVSRQDDSINADSTIELFKQIEKHYPNASKITIVCDNARYYKSKLVQEYLINSKIHLKFLPPYSPNLNLIERFWKFFHKKVTYNQYYEKFSQFKEAVNEFFDAVPKYRRELTSLLSQKFHIINSQTKIA